MALQAGRASAVRTVICALLLSSVDAYHFAGGLFTWAPTGNGSEIKVDFRLSWTRSSHHCDDTTISSGDLIGEGILHCFTDSGCPDFQTLLVHCTDFSETDDWSSGRNSFTYTPSTTQFSFGYSSFAWRSLVVGGGSWSLKTTADVSRRPDTNRTNSSPTVEMSPVVALQHGCQHKIILPVYDADGDFIRCRFASGLEECGGVCGAFPADLNETSCVLEYTANGATGWYAVAVQIEDFLSASSTTPLSSVSLQFLVNVFNTTGSCSSAPVFVPPTPASDTCFPISVNEHFTFTVVAFNSATSIKGIDTVKSGPSTTSSQYSNSTGNYMRLDVNWTPTDSNAGSQAMCFIAIDSNGLRSEQRCVHLYVEGVVLGGYKQPSVAMTNKNKLVMKRKGCPKPPTIDHGTWKYNSTVYGQQANLTCDRGYQSSGDVTLVCGEDETWQGQHPSCTIVAIRPGDKCLEDLTGVSSQCRGEEFSCRFDIATGNFRCLCSPELISSFTQDEVVCLKKSGYGGMCQIREQCTTFLAECARTGLDQSTCVCPARTSYNKTADECTTNVILFCPAAKDQLGHWWNKTRVLTAAYQPCPEGSSGQIIRKCLIDGTFSSALYNCTKEVFKNLTDQIKSTNITTKEALESLQRALTETNNSSELHAGDVDDIETVLAHIAEKEDNETASTEQLKENAETFFDIADMLTDPETSGAVWESKVEQTNKGAEKFIETIDRYGLKLAKTIESSNESILTIPKDNLVVSVSKVSEDPKNDLKYPFDDELPFNTSRTSSFTLSSESLSGQTDKITSVVVVVYRNMSKALPKTIAQQTSQSTFATITSQVLSIQLLPKPPEVLDPPIQLTFGIDKQREGFESHCSFWKPSIDGTTGRWSTSGCTRTMANATIIQCSCNHLTNFAILASPVETPSEHQTALTAISLTGCGVSIVCLVITLILHVTYWRVLKGDRNVLAMTVCASLLVAYLLFVFGVTRTTIKGLCTTVAVLLHYTFLLVFFLLLAEGIYMALQIVLPFHKKSHLKELLIGAFTIPAVFVLIVGSATELHGYGNDRYCWLTVDTLAFWMFVGPALMVIVFNLTIIILILKKMSSTKWIKDMSQREKAKTLASKTLVMLPVMGVTWLFGILSVHESAIWLQYLFVIFNSFQGFFIFLFHCVLNRQLRAAISKSRQHISTLSEEPSRSHGNTDHSINLTTITHVEPTSTVAYDFKTDHVVAADLKDCKDGKEDHEETKRGSCQNDKEDHEEDKEERVDLKQTKENQTESRNDRKEPEDEQKQPDASERKSKC